MEFLRRIRVVTASYPDTIQLATLTYNLDFSVLESQGSFCLIFIQRFGHARSMPIAANF